MRIPLIIICCNIEYEIDTILIKNSILSRRSLVMIKEVYDEFFINIGNLEIIVRANNVWFVSDKIYTKPYIGGVYYIALMTMIDTKSTEIVEPHRTTLTGNRAIIVDQDHIVYEDSKSFNEKIIITDEFNLVKLAYRDEVVYMRFPTVLFGILCIMRELYIFDNIRPVADLMGNLKRITQYGATIAH